MVLNAEQIKVECCKDNCSTYSSDNYSYVYNSYGSDVKCSIDKSLTSGKYNCGFQTLTNDRKELNIDKCINKEYNSILNNIDILETGNVLNDLNKQNNYTKGMMIGAIITIIICLVLFFMVKFRIFYFIYNQFKLLIKDHFPLFVLGLVFSIIIATIIFYIFWKVKGYGIKSHEHIGYYELFNTTTESGNINKIPMPKSYKLGNAQTMNESYLFNLNVKETNKNNTSTESCVFAVVKSNTIPTRTENVHLFVSLLNHENILRINSNKLEQSILIDNIPFEEDIFLSIIFNKEMIEVYINAKLVKNKIYKNVPIINNVNPENLNIFIGPQVHVYNNTKYKNIKDTINGNIDLTMYNIPLTHTEITQHYMSFIKVTFNYVKYMYNLFIGMLRLPKKILFGNDTFDKSTDCNM